MSDPLDILFTRLRTSPFAGVDPNSVPQEGKGDIEATGFVNVVENADRGVIIDKDGITINFGSLTLRDQFGENVVTGAGFGSSWLDFLNSGCYNDHFQVGTTDDIVAATEVSGGDTDDDYAASISDDIPYWVVSSESGAGTLKRVADTAAVGGYALQWDGSEDATIYQDVPILALARYGIHVSWRFTNSSSEFAFEIGYQFRDSSHGAIGVEVDQSIAYTTTQADYEPRLFLATSESPANARYLRVVLHISRTSGSPTVWVNGLSVQQFLRGPQAIYADPDGVSTLVLNGDFGGNFSLKASGEAQSRIVMLGNTTGPAAIGLASGADPYDVVLRRSAASVLQLGSTWGGGTLVALDGATALLRGFSGTSFPASPSTNDRFFRTDHLMWFVYDGTRWLSETLFTGTFPYQRALTPFAVTSSGDGPPPHPTLDVWVETVYGKFFVNATNDGTKYWSIAGASTPAFTLSTQSNAPNAWVVESVAVNAAYVAGSTWGYTATKVSTPGSLYIALAYTYRLIAT